MGRDMLSRKIKKLRIENKLSQEEFAAKLEVSRQSVYNWESGKAVPDYNKILLLCKLFGTTPGEFFAESDCDGDTSEQIVSADEFCADNYRESARKKPKAILRIVTLVLLLVLGVALFIVGIKGLMWGFEDPDTISSLCVVSINLSYDNIISLIMIACALAIISVTVAVFVKKHKIKAKRNDEFKSNDTKEL